MADEKLLDALRKIMEAHRFNVASMTPTEVYSLCFEALDGEQVLEAPAETGLVHYTTQGIPSKVGVYACRVDGDLPGLKKDIFLMWIEGKWGYLGSDQNYRGKVHGWIGPLERRMKEEA